MSHHRNPIHYLKQTAALILLGWVAVACAGTPVTDGLRSGGTGDAGPGALPTRVELTETPFFAQTEYYCGPAAMAAALNTTGLDTTPDKIAETLFTPGLKGTLQSEVVTSARRNGRLAIRIDGMADGFREVADGRPVLILQNLGLDIAPQWHYALLNGYDLAAGEAYLRSGTTKRLALDMETLEHTWRRGRFWGVVVTGPEGPVPRTADPGDWLAEAAGLERAGRQAEAHIAYRTGVKHWPDNPRPLLALANLQYSRGDMGAAETSLREAVARDEANDAALNNLAYVLLKLGETTEAEEIARRAIALDGPNKAEAQATLAEIAEAQ